MEKWKRNLIALIIIISITLIMLVVVYIIVPLILPEYPFNIGFFILSVVILGIASADITYILTYRKKNKGKYYISFGWWRLNEKKIKKYVDKDLWDGAGTQESPYRILDWSKLPYNLAISITNTTSYIAINSGDSLKSLTLNNCQNISVNNCELSYLKLSRCINSTIRNNIIHSLSISNIYKNRIIENKLSEKGLGILEKKSIIQRNYIDNNTLLD